MIDPGGDAPDILEMVSTAGVKLDAVLITHGHFDHIAATAALVEETGAKVYGSPEAAEVLASPEKHQIFPGMGVFPPASVDVLVEQDADYVVAGIALRAIMTPGHSAGSITWYCEKGLFCGDLLFYGSIGRTDLPGGSFEELAASVRKLVLMYPPETVVYTGHGSSTTLGREQESNPFLTDMRW